MWAALPANYCIHSSSAYRKTFYATAPTAIMDPPRSHIPPKTYSDKLNENQSNIDPPRNYCNYLEASCTTAEIFSITSMAPPPLRKLDCRHYETLHIGQYSFSFTLHPLAKDIF